MKPIDTKTMFAMLCKYMEKLEKGEVDANEAFAMTKLVGQASNLLNYELKRAALLANNQFAKEHREIEMNTVKALPGSVMNFENPT